MMMSHECLSGASLGRCSVHFFLLLVFFHDLLLASLQQPLKEDQGILLL